MGNMLMSIVLIWEKIMGPIPPGMVIHHKDENRLNNDISNLECDYRIVTPNAFNAVRK